MGVEIYPHTKRRFMMKNYKKKQLCSINVVESDSIAFATGVTTYRNNDSGKPESFVIKIATDPDKIPTHVLSVPVYLPVSGNFESYSHYEMLDLFKRGDPFVAVEFDNLKLHISQQGSYYGLAQGFTVVTNPHERLDYLL